MAGSEPKAHPRELASNRLTLSRPRTKSGATGRKVFGRGAQNTTSQRRYGYSILQDRQTPRLRARTWRRCCGKLGSVDNGEYRLPANHHHRVISAAFACGATDCRGGVDNKLLHGWRAWPTGNADVFAQAARDRSRRRMAGPPGVRRTAFLTAGALPVRP